LAILILHGSSYRTERGETLGSGFLFDMNRVFEDFLGAALSRWLEVHGGRVILQDRSHLDRASTVDIRPDITWWSEDRCASVIDAKYRTLPASSANEDLYQMLAYCTAYDVRQGHLVYAHTETDEQRTHVVRNAGVELHAHAVGLDQPPDKILERVQGVLTGG
jgi:5-methylcytosine-specific restriction enzyme subunit McrC